MRLLAYKPVAKYTASYLTTPVLTTGWTEVIAETEKPCSAIELFSGSGSVIKLSIGASGQEDLFEMPYYVTPGGSAILLPFEIPGGARVSARAVDADATAGTLVINLFG